MKRWTDVHWVGIAAGLALFGDSALYAVLPAESRQLRLGALEVGVLLSVNRLARILFNRATARAVFVLGLEIPLAFALVLAAATTFGYGHVSFAGFVALRIVWGLAWSLLRNGASAAVLAQEPARMGELQGSFRSLARIGSLVSVAGGSWLVGRVGFKIGYEWLAVATIPGVLAALATRTDPRPLPIPAARDRDRAILGVSAAAFAVNAAASSLLLATVGFAIGDLIPASTAVGSATPNLFGVPMTATGIAGLAITCRWIAEIAVAPLAGSLSDRFGRRPVVVAGGLLAAGALGGCATARTLDAFVPAAVFAFATLVMFQTALDIVATEQARERPVALGWYFTVVDVGTAIGPLVGPLALAHAGAFKTYLGAALVVALVAGAYTWSGGSESGADHARLHADG